MVHEAESEGGHPPFYALPSCLTALLAGAVVVTGAGPSNSRQRSESVPSLA